MRLQALVLPALARVFYPALVEYRRQPERFVSAYSLGTVALASLEVLGGYFLFFNAEVVLVDIFLGPQWHAAVPLLRILAFLPMIEALNRLGGEVLKVRHEDRLWLACILANLACLVGFGIAFTRLWGAAGMAWAGPSPQAISQMGDKIAAKALAEKAQVPTLPGTLDLSFGVSIAMAGVAAAILWLRLRRPFQDFLSGQHTNT